eukprot:jgi/Ulvmu1/9274/UM050_0023.1
MQAHADLQPDATSEGDSCKSADPFRVDGQEDAACMTPAVMALAQPAQEFPSVLENTSDHVSDTDSGTTSGTDTTTWPAKHPSTSTEDVHESSKHQFHTSHHLRSGSNPVHVGEGQGPGQIDAPPTTTPPSTLPLLGKADLDGVLFPSNLVKDDLHAWSVVPVGITFSYGAGTEHNGGSLPDRLIPADGSRRRTVQLRFRPQRSKSFSSVEQIISGRHEAATVEQPASQGSTSEHRDGVQHEKVTVAIRSCPVLNSAQVACKLSASDASVTLTRSLNGTDAAIGNEADPLLARDCPSMSFRFDAVFDCSCSTRRVYDQVIQQVVQSALKGINGTVLAAGSTNTGKTHTIVGVGGSLGLITMALMDVLAATAEHHTTRSYTLTATLVEIYNEQLIDLLADDGGSAPVHIVVCLWSSNICVPMLSCTSTKLDKNFGMCLESSAIALPGTVSFGPLRNTAQGK